MSLGWSGWKHRIQVQAFVLAVGVSHYKDHAFAELPFPAKDAADFSRALKQQKARSMTKLKFACFPMIRRRSEVIKGLQWIRDSATPDDITAIFLAATESTMGDSIIFCPSTPRRVTWSCRLAFASDQLHHHAHQREKNLVLDTCHSGNAAKNGFNDINGFINEQSSESHAWVYAATTGNEVAVEDRP